jgi:hypothetical protein
MLLATLAQVLAMFSSTKIVWPSFIKNLYNMLSLFNFNLNITAPECAFSIQFQYKWALTELIPIGLGSLFLLAHVLKIFQKRFIKKKKGESTTSPLRVP